ncbi:kynurenine--oxoglutarate transaminase 3-like [Bolinopsis microptera]|uniref:kynurenine--oxoglutarate transaminase 3-like n=1 Tax=Bolinopsis microptera TaxID=2820187 RepID=UPI00307A241B
MEIGHADKISELGAPSMWIEWGDLARKNNSCNLGSGFPNFPLHPDLREELVSAAENPVTCWYTRAQGHPKLIEEIIATYSPLVGREIQPTEAIVTIGAYQGIFWSFEAFVQAGDEVIVFDPMFDAYRLDCVLAGAKFVPVALKLESGSWVLEEELFKNSFNCNTKMIVVNTPHNPTGKVFTRKELEFISKLSKEYNCLILADEVYDRYVFDGHEHLSIASLPGMWERTITLCSAGKMFGVTGWRVGWAFGGANLIEKLFRICKCDTFGASTILQEALAGMLQRQRLCIPPKESYFQWASNIFVENYTKLQKAFTNANMPVIPAEGGFFMIVDCTKRRFKFQDSPEFQSSVETFDIKIAKGIVNKYKLSVLPLSLFYGSDSKSKLTSYLRVCFAKSPESVDKAVEIIESFE